MKIIINKIKEFGELTFSDYTKEIYMIIVIIIIKKEIIPFTLKQRETIITN